MKSRRLAHTCPNKAHLDDFTRLLRSRYLHGLPPTTRQVVPIHPTKAKSVPGD